MKRKQTTYIIVFLVLFYLALQILSVWHTYTSTKDEVAKNSIMISKIVRDNIDVEKYQEIVKTRTKNDYYYKVHRIIDEVKKSTGAKYIYIERKIDENQIEYIISDGNNDCLGEKDVNKDNLAFISKESTNLGITESKWGTLLTGFSPILDKDNNVVGLVGVDYEFSLATDVVRSAIINELKDISIFTLFLVSFMFLLYYLNKLKEKDVSKFYAKMVNSLTIILSKKSDYTWKHSERVSEISEVLAKKFFKCEKKIQTIKWASLLHDIGKIGIPNEILDKPGKLTNEEFEEIKKHTTYSKEMLENVFFKDNTSFSIDEMTTISDIAKYHHERYDGTGYPCRLKGEEIPFMARIVSVADAYEAMTAERPYKKPMSKEKALEQILSGAGTQFDPIVVTAFVECVKLGTI